MNLYRRTQQLQGAERTMQKAEKAMREICKAIGKELRQMREDRHIKQITLAKQLGISPSHLFEIEDGSVMLDEKRLKQIYWQIKGAT